MKAKLIGLIAALLLGTVCQAQDPQRKQTAEEGCQQLLQVYGQLDVKAYQADVVAAVQKGILQICKGLIAAEQQAKQTPAPTPTAMVTPEQVIE